MIEAWVGVGVMVLVMVSGVLSGIFAASTGPKHRWGPWTTDHGLVAHRECEDCHERRVESFRSLCDVR